MAALALLCLLVLVQLIGRTQGFDWQPKVTTVSAETSTINAHQNTHAEFSSSSSSFAVVDEDERQQVAGASINTSFSVGTPREAVSRLDVPKMPLPYNKNGEDEEEMSKALTTKNTPIEMEDDSGSTFTILLFLATVIQFIAVSPMCWWCCPANCPPGQYNNGGSCYCYSCPPGTYTGWWGASWCSGIPGGYYGWYYGQSYCCYYACSPGYFSYGGASGCQAAYPGTQLFFTPSPSPPSSCLSLCSR